MLRSLIGACQCFAPLLCSASLVFCKRLLSYELLDEILKYPIGYFKPYLSPVELAIGIRELRLSSLQCIPELVLSLEQAIVFRIRSGALAWWKRRWFKP